MKFVHRHLSAPQLAREKSHGGNVRQGNRSRCAVVHVLPPLNISSLFVGTCDFGNAKLRPPHPGIMLKAA